MIKIPPLRNYFYQEIKHLSSFYIVLFIAGILTGLSFPATESVFLKFITSLIILFGFSHRYPLLKPIIFLIFFFMLGMGVITYRIRSTQTPMISRLLYDTELTGTVSDVSHLFQEQRIILSDINFLNQPSVQTPTKVKLSYEDISPLFQVGDKIHVRAFLRPPLSPSAPNMYHEKRMSFFQGIGAIGKITSILNLSQRNNNPFEKLSSVRHHISEQIQKAMPEETARVAIPLVIGEQNVISEYLYNIFRSSGIIHVLSVSGFHLALLSAFVFFLIRTILSLLPVIVERFSTKKIAAVITLILTGAYILISGMQIPAIRSFIMIGIVLIALLFDRNALSTHSLSLAAFMILLCAPEMILNIGFQLSFMAVLILTTIYPQLRHFLFPNKPTSWFKQFFVLIACLLILDFLITAATLPLTVYHFKQIAPYGIIGNLLTTTVLSFWIMPCLFLGLIFLPFGLENFFFKSAAIGLEYIIGLCDKIASLPQALINTPALDTIGVILITLGIVLLCLMKTPLRLTGVFVIIIGLFTSLNPTYPDILIGDKGQTVAVYQDGQLRFLSHAPNDWTTKSWLTFFGQQDIIKTDFPREVYLKGKKISFHTKSCLGADLCILSHPAPKEANAISLFEDKTRFIYLNRNNINIKKIDF